MKKFFIVVLSMAFIFALTGCMKGTVESSSFTDSASMENPTTGYSTSSSSIEETTAAEEITTTEETTTEDSSYRTDKNVLNYLYNGDVPRINITTENNVFPYNKTDYVKGSLNITDQDKNRIIMIDKSMGIRLRGNSTLSAAKKAFRIKFDSKVSLFGLGKAKNWVLLANYYDKSNIRNYIAYLTANKMKNLNFEPSSVFVDVYINNEYQGLYLLTEQIQVSENRIDLDESVTNGDSYMLEIDFLDRQDGDGAIQGIDYFMSYGMCYVIKYPETHTEEICAKIKSDIDDINYHLYAYEDIEDYIDVESFIDYYFIGEMMKNTDAATSIYLYKEKDGVLTAGPVWDFDIGLDVVGINDNNQDYAWVHNSVLYYRENNPILRILFQHKEFEELVKEEYKSARDALYEVFDEIKIIQESLEKAFIRNEAKWPVTRNDNTYIEYRYDKYYMSLTSTEAHINYVTEELKERLKLMDDTYLDN